MCVCVCACACRQGCTKWLGHNRTTVLLNEDYSSATCYRCFMVHGDIQRMEAVPRQHDKRCPLCGQRPRDVNAGAWIDLFGRYREAHGRMHPVQELAEAEAEKRIAAANAAAARRAKRMGAGAGGAPAPTPQRKRQRPAAPAQQE